MCSTCATIVLPHTSGWLNRACYNVYISKVNVHVRMTHATRRCQYTFYMVSLLCSACDIMKKGTKPYACVWLYLWMTRCGWLLVSSYVAVGLHTDALSSHVRIGP